MGICVVHFLNDGLPVGHAGSPIVQEMNDAYTHIFLVHTIWDNAFSESIRGVCDRTSPDGVPLRCVVNGVSWFDSVWLND